MNSIRCRQCEHYVEANAGEGKIYGCDRSKCVFEPTTKNDKVDCEHTDCNNCVNHKCCDYEPTTENDLEVQKAIEIIQADSLASYSVNEILSARDLTVEALKQMATTKNDLVVDCISREQALRELKESAEHHANDSREEVLLRRDRDIIRALPSVTPQEPRKGHWIIDTHKIRAFGKKNETHDYSVHCDKCNYAWDYTTDEEGSLVSNFCPNCGADMREVEE